MRLLDLFKRKQLTSPAKEIPRYTVKGFINEKKVHLGACVSETGYREVCYLMFENGEWVLYRNACWHIHRGADDGREIKIELNCDYFISNNICTLEQFLNYIYQGEIVPCRSLLQSHKNVLDFLDNLVKARRQARDLV